MEDPGREIAYPTVEQICDTNRRMISSFGGRFVPPSNFLNRDALEYILVAVSAPIYGLELYPSLKDKAAGLAFHIITRHVFVDGNKRTGAHVAWEFLRGNGISVWLDSSIIDLTEAVADGVATYDDLKDWLHRHQ